jgi:hypothetical protein
MVNGEAPRRRGVGEVGRGEEGGGRRRKVENEGRGPGRDYEIGTLCTIWEVAL